MLASILDTGHALPDRMEGGNYSLKPRVVVTIRTDSGLGIWFRFRFRFSVRRALPVASRSLELWQRWGLSCHDGAQLGRSREFGGVGVTIAACQLQRRRPRLALSARALAEFALELGLRWSCKCVCIWHMTLYIPQATSLSPFVPSPFSARSCSLSVCPSRRPIKY